MEDSIIFRKLEDYTLKRNKELVKLRSLTEDFLNGRTSYEVVKNYIIKVSKTRSNLKKSIELCESPNIRREFLDHMKTLITFVIMVSVNDEEDILTDLRTYLLNNGMREEADFIDSELTKIKDLSNTALRVLKTLPTA
ncbi:MAG: hypothetical protein QN229_00650 [Desulfurococcaceae archaeon TW002]